MPFAGGQQGPGANANSLTTPLFRDAGLPVDRSVCRASVFHLATREPQNHRVTVHADQNGPHSPPWLRVLGLTISADVRSKPWVLGRHGLAEKELGHIPARDLCPLRRYLTHGIRPGWRTVHKARWPSQYPFEVRCQKQHRLPLLVMDYRWSDENTDRDWILRTTATSLGGKERKLLREHRTRLRTSVRSRSEVGAVTG